MAWWKRTSREPAGAIAATAVQTGRGDPYAGASALGVPLMRPEVRLLRAICDAVPLVGAAVQKLVQLVGEFHVACDDRRAQEELGRFFEEVPVGCCSSGIASFIAQYLEQLLVCGTAVGEMVLSPSRADIAALYNAPLETLELGTGASPLELRVWVHRGSERVPAPCPELLCISALNPEPGRVEGTSLLSGLPFVSSVLMRIYQTIGVNFDRVGNLRFAVTYKPSNDTLDRAMAKERANEIAREWGRAMQDGKVSDFVAVGDVDIRVIGADCPMPDTEIPVRQMLEQIVAKLGVPPFLLGLSWSSTERMSSQQADILTSELDAYRRLLDPVILKISRLWLSLHGYRCRPQVVWEAANLQDEVELARARLMQAQAARIEQELTVQAAAGDGV